MSQNGKHQRDLLASGDGPVRSLKWGDLKSTREGLAEFFRKRGMVVGSKKLTRADRARLSLTRRQERERREGAK